VIAADGPRHALDRALSAAESASPVDAAESVTRELARTLHATAVSFLIADLSGRALVRLAHVRSDEQAPADGDRHRGDDRESATVLPFDGGPQEEVVRSQRALVLPPRTPAAGDPDAPGGRHGADDSDAWTVLAPVTERGESLGLLEMLLPVEPDADTVAEVARAARLLAFVVIANRRHTDLYEWGQRTRPFTLSAEIQRRLLPAAFTCEADAFTLSGWLEPAASVGGDTFDYSVARDALHLSMTDAMGHGVGSALTASLCVGSLRTVRRRGGSLLEQATAANAALVEHVASVQSEAFVTGVMGRLDLVSGDLTLVNAGHVAPYLARAGEVAPVALPPGLPLGLFADAVYSATTLPLRPGDRLVFVTDGMLERNAANFVLSTGIRDTRALHARDAVRHLSDRILDITGDELADDATIMVLDWRGGHVSDRSA